MVSAAITGQQTPTREPHWCLDQTFLQCISVVDSDEDLPGMASEATGQVSLVQTRMSPEIYSMRNVYRSKCMEAVDHIWTIVG